MNSYSPFLWVINGNNRFWPIPMAIHSASLSSIFSRCDRHVRHRRGLAEASAEYHTRMVDTLGTHKISMGFSTKKDALRKMTKSAPEGLWIWPDMYIAIIQKGNMMIKQWNKVYPTHFPVVSLFRPHSACQTSIWQRRCAHIGDCQLCTVPMNVTRIGPSMWKSSKLGLKSFVHIHLQYSLKTLKI